MSIAEQLKTATENVPKVYSAGCEKGYSSGYSDGYNQSEDDFWDGIQDGGNRTCYEYGFYFWGNEYIRPKYKIVLSGGATTTSTANGKRSLQMFMNCRKLKIVEKEYFDFSQYNFVNNSSSYGNYAVFRGCWSLEEVQDIGMMPTGMYYQTFRECPKLKKIEIMRVEEATKFDNVFTGCSSLENIVIDGTIGQDGFDMSDCEKLSKESIISIVSALSENLTGPKTITLPSVAMNKYFKSADGTVYTDEWMELIKPKANWHFAFA